MFYFPCEFGGITRFLSVLYPFSATRIPSYSRGFVSAALRRLSWLLVHPSWNHCILVTWYDLYMNFVWPLYDLSDVDECLGSPCAGNAICTNTAGGYECKCGTNFAGDAYGTMDCECATGFTKQGSTCVGEWLAVLLLDLALLMDRFVTLRDTLLVNWLIRCYSVFYWL